MPKRKDSTEEPQNLLDTFSKKRQRGRPYKIRASEVTGRAYNYRIIFSQIWDKLEERLLNAGTEEEVLQAFEQTTYKQEFAVMASLILTVLREPDFPKRDREARISFLADSLAARGVVTPRSSRDICKREKAGERRKSKHKILRHEFYIECSCGYKGPALNNACRDCGAEIGISLQEMLGPALF